MVRMVKYRGARVHLCWKTTKKKTKQELNKMGGSAGSGEGIMQMWLKGQIN